MALYCLQERNTPTKNIRISTSLWQKSERFLNECYGGKYLRENCRKPRFFGNNDFIKESTDAVVQRCSGITSRENTRGGFL